MPEEWKVQNNVNKKHILANGFWQARYIWPPNSSPFDFSQPQNTPILDLFSGNYRDYSLHTPLKSHLLIFSSICFGLSESSWRLNFPIGPHSFPKKIKMWRNVGQKKKHRATPKKSNCSIDSHQTDAIFWSRSYIFQGPSFLVSVYVKFLGCRYPNHFPALSKAHFHQEGWPSVRVGNIAF